jgi:hypothetical protein
MTSDNDKVICPHCVTEFVAVPVKTTTATPASWLPIFMLRLLVATAMDRALASSKTLLLFAPRCCG